MSIFYDVEKYLVLLTREILCTVLIDFEGHFDTSLRAVSRGRETARGRGTRL